MKNNESENIRRKSAEMAKIMCHGVAKNKPAAK
jgi:hypothetical protein